MKSRTLCIVAFMAGTAGLVAFLLFGNYFGIALVGVATGIAASFSLQLAFFTPLLMFLVVFLAIAVFIVYTIYHATKKKKGTPS